MLELCIRIAWYHAILDRLNEVMGPVAVRQLGYVANMIEQEMELTTSLITQV